METLINNKKYIIGAVIVLAIIMVHACGGRGFMGRYGQNGVQNTISVSADGDAYAVPDIANISFTLSKDAATSGAASKDLNAQTAKVLAFLKESKIADKDVKAEYGGVYPKYSNTVINCFVAPCPQPEPKITGYTASQSITVKIRDVDTANEIKTGLSKIEVGNISGPTFSIDDEDVLKDTARAAAIVKARAKAEVLAKELGVKLGKVTSFSENGGGYPMMYAAKAMDSSMGGAPAPVLPKGENKITTSVTITYEIR
ncbi:MAG: SIMPL domain-containing protein [Candidatus Nomurabacteria bacterium]|nr:SIMPL domain-containing protein [Candidatus Nomurabacteria bacterium]